MNEVKTAWGAGFFSQTWAQWALFFLVFVFAWSFSISAHQWVRSRV